MSLFVVDVDDLCLEMARWINVVQLLLEDSTVRIGQTRDEVG
jgi:hypothetical protein